MGAALTFDELLKVSATRRDRWHTPDKQRTS